MIRKPVMQAGAVIDGLYHVESVDHGEVRAVDISTGRTVLIYPDIVTAHAHPFVTRVYIETVVRLAASLRHPRIAHILSEKPRVVLDAPPPSLRPTMEFTTEGIAALAILALDVIARCHEIGVSGIALDARNARLRESGGAWDLTVVYPPILEFPFERLLPTHSDAGLYGAVLWDLGAVADLVGRLCSPGADDGEAGGPLPDAFRTTLEPLVPISWGRRTRQISNRDPGIDPAACRSARELAEALLPLAPIDPRWREFVAAMPRVTRIAPVRDWDTIIERGEAALADRLAREEAMEKTIHEPQGVHPLQPQSAFFAAPPTGSARWRRRQTDIGEPLAAAYHARGCVALSLDDRGRARACLDAAIELDGAAAYYVTRGFLSTREGDSPRAMSDFNFVLGPSRSGSYVDSLLDGIPFQRKDTDQLALARGHYCRGCISYERGEIGDAICDFDRASTFIQNYKRSPHVRPVTESVIDMIAPLLLRVERARSAARRRLQSAT